jgi:hypothetical protein
MSANVSAMPTPTPRQPYSAPSLKPLGRWQAVTLQQSVPIFP